MVKDFQGDGTVDALTAGDLLPASWTVKTITQVRGEAKTGIKMKSTPCKDSKDQGGFYNIVEVIKRCFLGF